MKLSSAAIIVFMATYVFHVAEARLSTIPVRRTKKKDKKKKENKKKNKGVSTSNKSSSSFLALYY